jgi:outer membrane lipoprotein-sorting protein
MYRKILSLFLVIMIAVLTCHTVAAAVAEFSADFTMTENGNVITGKTFIKGNKIRKVAAVQGQTVITILRPDKKVAWTLMPDEKQYIEIGLAFDPARPSADAGTEYAYDQKTIGHEKVNGYDCDVIQYAYKKKIYGVLVQWFSSKLNFAIKYQIRDTNGKVISTQEYKNIKTGNVADSLFEIPAGYTKFSMN